MMPLQIKEIIKAIGGDLISANPPPEVRGISTDTRTLLRGDLFIALKGEKFDGHTFIEEALKKGAVGAIVSEVRSQKSEDRRQRTENRNRVVIKVKDTLKALGDIAKIYRKKFSKIKVIAVTGSNGKTTTKEMLGYVLSKRFNVLKAKASFNNFVGVPLTLLEIRKDTQVVILEMETNLLGGIRKLANVAKPWVGIVTNISDTHLQFLKTRESVFKEKTELIESLPSCGIAVLNADDPYVVKMKGLAEGRRVITFGIKNKSDFRASCIEIKDKHLEFILNPALSATQRRFVVRKGGVNGQYKVRLNTIFYGNVYNALAAVATAHLVFGLNLEAVVARLEEFRFPPMRMELIRLKDMKIINDCYNANPQSMREALLTLKGIQTYGRKIAVLGDMLELGQNSADFHYQIGKLCGACQIDILITVGNLACHVRRGAEEAGILKENIFTPLDSKRLTGFTLDNTQSTAQLLSNILKPKDVILIKGSRKMRMEEVVERLMAKFQSGKLKEGHYDLKRIN